VGVLVHGKICSDRPEGLTCTQPAPSGHIGGWEALEMVDAGRGWIAFKGGRAGKYCADDHDGIKCDRPHLDDWEMFRVHSDEGVGGALVQTQERSEAAVFVVGRSSVTSPEVTLRCKGNGLYLQVDQTSKALTCSSESPKHFNYHRLDGAKWWSATKGSFQDPSSGKYVKAEGAQWGGHVKAVGEDAGGWQLFDVQLTEGYEDVYPLVRGVNLGSWFLLEKWMVGFLFTDDDGGSFGDVCAAQDEYGLMDHLDAATKRSRMERHWSTWITEEDISWIAGHGLNTVRVPFGYWMTHPEPPFVGGQLEHMGRLFEWCEKHGVAVLLDFHGLKGSQNGAQTSGNCGACGKASCGTTWKSFLEHQDTNLAVIERMVSRFAASPAYFGFGIANEVGTMDSHGTMAFYQKAYDIIRRHSPDSFVFIDSTFNPSSYPLQGEIHVGQDDHMYFSAKFKDKASRLNMQNLEKARGRQLNVERWQLLIGEWALDHHGHYLGGYSDGAREAWTKDFSKAQLQAFEQHSMGWIYWSYKVDYHRSTWNFRHLCERGLVPGCVSGAGFDYAPDGWFERHPCAYAYLDPSHMGSGCRDKALTV